MLPVLRSIACVGARTLRVLVEVCDGRGKAVHDGADRGEALGDGEATGSGLSIPAGCKKLGISDQTFYRWRLEEDEAQRLKALEEENARLKRIVAEQALEISLMKDCSGETSEPGSAPGSGGLPGAQAQGLAAARRASRVAWALQPSIDPELTLTDLEE